MKINQKKERYDYFEEIYYKYVKLVSFLVSKYINDEETIKDITNETFLLFFNNRYKVKKSVKYYLVKTAKNISLKYLEKNNNYVLYDDDVMVENKNLDSFVDYSLLIDKLKEKLTEEEINIIIWHVIEGFTFKEIAAYLNSNQKAVNKKYERAIKKYKKKEESYE